MTDIKKLSRKELEQQLDQIRELAMRQQRQLIAKNRLIEHLSENARNWTKKIKSVDTQPPKRGDDEAKQEIAQELEIQTLQSKLSRLNELNLGLVKRLALMQETQEDELHQRRRSELKTNASAVSQNTPKFPNTSVIGDTHSSSKTTVSAPAENQSMDNSMEETSELEFSPEMQKILAKYAA